MKRLMVLLLTCCGGESTVLDAGQADPRDAFVGTWHGQYVSTVTGGGQTTQSQGAADWKLSYAAGTVDRVTWSTKACVYTARATSDSSLVLEPVNCATQVTDAGCSISVSVKQGSGTRSGTSLSVTLGADVIAQCTGGGPDNGTMTLRFDGSKL